MCPETDGAAQPGPVKQGGEDLDEGAALLQFLASDMMVIYPPPPPRIISSSSCAALVAGADRTRYGKDSTGMCVCYVCARVVCVKCVCMYVR